MNLLGKAGNRDFWEKEVRNKEMYRKYREDCLRYFKEKDLANYRFPALQYSQFKLFFTTGDRGIYEREYFARRSAIEFTVPLALMYPEEDIYLERIMDWVYIICDEYTWCLPAHQNQLDENDNSRIDLFAAEMGFHLALVYTVLGDRLEPLIKNRIKVEIDRRIFKTFLGCENYGWWETGNSNWTAVCMGSVACTMMLMAPELVDGKMIDRFNRAMECYLKGFHDDGICLEGCGYWAYGVGFFQIYADMIRTFTNGEVDYFNRPKVRSIATFPQKMFLTGNAAVSFADSGRTLRYVMSVLHRFKAEYPEDVLIYSPELGVYSQGCGRLSYLFFAPGWMSEEVYNNPASDKVTFEYYAENSQWLVKRTENYGFAAKAGHNAELHNHNDVGSFIFAKDGRQLLVDLGSGKYDRRYFSSERYSILECGSFGHSVPLVGGAEQKVGKDYSSTDVSYSEGSFSMDIAGAYKVDGLNSLRRSFEFDNDSVKLTDEYDYTADGAIVDRIVSVVKPELVAEGRLAVGEALVEFDASAADLSIAKTAGTSTANAEVYLIDFTLKAGVRRFEIVMK